MTWIWLFIALRIKCWELTPFFNSIFDFGQASSFLLSNILYYYRLLEILFMYCIIIIGIHGISSEGINRFLWSAARLYVAKRICLNFTKWPHSEAILIQPSKLRIEPLERKIDCESVSVGAKQGKTARYWSR